jgi:hypothetical protein
VVARVGCGEQQVHRGPGWRKRNPAKSTGAAVLLGEDQVNGHHGWVGEKSLAKPKKKHGVRIPYVVDDRGQTYDRHAIDVKPRPPYVPPLKCKGCGIPVSARSSNADDPDSRSSHYFKLPGGDHASTCAYDLNRRGKYLAGTSQGTVVRREGQWRLKCPPLERPGTRGGIKNPSGPARPPWGGGGGGTRPTSKLRGPAIASARRIVELLEDFQHDPETVAEFAAVAPGGQHNIAWDEFCYGRGRVDQLAQALIDGTARQIPHAVWGPASTADAVAGRTGESYVVKYIARNLVTIDGRRIKLQVALRCKDPEWIAAGKRSGKFLGYGYWTLFPADLAKARERGSIELQLWVKEPWQVERWDVSDAPATLLRPARPAAHRPSAEPVTRSVSRPVSRPAPAPPSPILPAAPEFPADTPSADSTPRDTNSLPSQRQPVGPGAVQLDAPAEGGTGEREPDSSESVLNECHHSNDVPAPNAAGETTPSAGPADVEPQKGPAIAQKSQPGGRAPAQKSGGIPIPPPPAYPPAAAPPPPPGFRRRGMQGWLDRLRRR